MFKKRQKRLVFPGLSFQVLSQLLFSWKAKQNTFFVFLQKLALPPPHSVKKKTQVLFEVFLIFTILIFLRYLTCLSEEHFLIDSHGFIVV